MQYIDDARLAGLGITPADVRAAIEDVLRAIEAGTVTIAPKTMAVAPDGRYMMATLSASDADGLIAVKSVMVNDRNKARGLPGINGAILLLDAETGVLRAVLDANWVTAERTAGLSAVAAARLAEPEASVLALIGAGVQADSHLRAFAAQFPLREVRVFGRGAAGVAAICDTAREMGLQASASATARECLEGADIIVSSVTLNYAIAPFLDGRWLKPGAFAAITDLAIPWAPDGMAAFDHVYVDDAAQERAMDKPMVAPDLVRGDLRDLVMRGATVGKGDRRAFVFRGIAAGDLAVAALAYRRAVEG